MNSLNVFTKQTSFRNHQDQIHHHPTHWLPDFGSLRDTVEFLKWKQQHWIQISFVCSSTRRHRIDDLGQMIFHLRELLAYLINYDYLQCLRSLWRIASLLGYGQWWFRVWLQNFYNYLPTIQGVDSSRPFRVLFLSLYPRSDFCLSPVRASNAGQPVPLSRSSLTRTFNEEVSI